MLGDQVYDVGVMDTASCLCAMSSVGETTSILHTNVSMFSNICGFYGGNYDANS